MKKQISLSLLTALVLAASGFAHERITFGPNGGKLVALDSPTTPSAEVVVKDGQFSVRLYDKDVKPIGLDKQTLTVTAGERSSPKKQPVEKKDNTFISPMPAGDDYWAIFQLKETPESKALTFRIHYQTAPCPDCKKPEWLCECGGKTSGANIEVPATLEGLWAEINQHAGELNDGYKAKKYEAIDEVTQAFTVLAKALPEKSKGLDSAKQQVVAALSETLVKDLAAIREANAGRKLADAKAAMESVHKNIDELKKNYPAATANAKLKE